MRLRASLFGISTVLLAAVQSAPAASSADGSDAAAERTTIVVQAGQTGKAAVRWLLGVNHHYNANGYDLWDEAEGAPFAAVVDGATRAGVQSLRFPGGTIANTYDWKRGIGPERGCQVDGRGTAATGFPAVTRRLAFGSDEYMEFLDRIQGEALIMVPFVTETPSDAADWVEYMNAPSGQPGNPNGGTDWADVRAANGHPEPYGVRRWEIGNEQDHLGSRYWMSVDTATAARQYAFGGSRTIVGEALGAGCDHPVAGIGSDGSANQVFEVLYPPVDASSVKVRVGNERWTAVSELGSAAAGARVFTVRPESGEVVFGDGEHGAVPRKGSRVVATYRSVHSGYFAFAAQMKAVDPSIKVCASFATDSFLDAVRGRDFDCLTTHAISAMAHGTGDKASWSDAVEGHDRIMLAAGARRRQLVSTLRSMPPGTPLWVTEATVIQGDRDSFPTWASSATQAAYMATLWGDWMTLGIPWAMSSDFLWGDRAVLGRRPDFVSTADAVTREAIAPMFTAGGQLVAASIRNNPVRRPDGMSGAYDALTVTALRATDGSVQVLVVNRLPTRAVSATLEIDGVDVQDGTVRMVSSDHFTDANTPENPDEVALTTDPVSVVDGQLRFVFPPTSTTVFDLS